MHKRAATFRFSPELALGVFQQHFEIILDPPLSFPSLREGRTECGEATAGRQEFTPEAS